MRVEGRRRLLIISSRARNKPAILESIHQNGVYTVEYNFENSSLEDILSFASKSLRNDRVVSIAFILHSSEKELFLCRPGEAKISLKTTIGDHQVRSFFQSFVSEHLDTSDSNARIDFLASYAAEHVDGGLISKELESLLKVEVGISSNLQGSDIQVVQKNDSKSEGPLSIGGMYFNLKTLETSLQRAGTVSKDGVSKLKGFDKIRLVGKGAFGNAILYQRRLDGFYVIIKEINMLELSSSDRALALNEVRVLAKMDHPNIVAYFDSFEVDGVLMIEMEYADGGNLADDLEKRTTRLRELEILDIFGQMVSAIRHMHSHNVLHRDLKTANIFLTKEGTVKIGDFGISKMLSTHHGGAMTVLGTPYYISPEMCEGKVYDEKSDIWALGCILYEMACLQKTFEGANLPALVNKIIRGQFAPIRGNYSPLFKQLVRDLLQKDPDFRPTSSHVMLVRLPELMAFNESLRVQEEEEERDAFILPELDRDPEARLSSELTNSGGINSFLSPQKPKASRPARSVLYDLKGHESGLRLTPIQLPCSIRILQVSCSGSHFIALSSEFLVYTWGQGGKGQLGHGALLDVLELPRCVESLKAKNITKVCAGEGFSVFASEGGILMTCGDGSFGCLGHGDWNSCGTPKLIETLLSVDVSAIACGSEHVVMVDTRGDVFSWGRGSYGRLGQGHEDDSCTPQKMDLKTEEMYIVDVKCNGNGTILLCDKGILYSCGENRYNRLGLDDQPFYMFGNHIERSLVPSLINSVKKKYKIVDFDMGIDHTVCITHEGRVVAFGKNADGQLGRGHTRNLISEGGSPEYVKALTDKEVSFVSCGPTFTLIGTNENVIYVWGTRHHAILGDGSDLDETLTMKDVILEPTELLALYASEQHLQRGETVVLSGILARRNHDILLWVETTCPLPRPPTNPSSDRVANPYRHESRTRPKHQERRREGGQSQKLPPWLEAELNDVEAVPKLAPSNQKSLQPNVPRVGNDRKMKQLENDYIKKKKEVLLEAEAAIRTREKALNNEVHRLREELDKQKGSGSDEPTPKQGLCSIQ